MNSEEKIEYMLHKIREEARISPAGYFFVNCYPYIDMEGNGGIPDEATVLFSSRDQANCLLKFKKDGLLFDVVFEKEGAMIALGSLDKDSEENPYKKRAIKQNTKNIDIVTVSVLTGELVLNKRTGAIRLNDVENVFNPIGREFKAILALATAKDNLVTFKELFGDYKTKAHGRDLGFILRDLKKGLGILPKKKPRNKDIFKSIPGYGYKLITIKNKRKKGHI